MSLFGLKIGNTAPSVAQIQSVLGYAPKPSFNFTYDFAVSGGAQGSIALLASQGALPDKFIIQNAIIEVITPLGSAGSAQAALTSGQSAGDLVAAAAVTGAPWSTAGIKATSILIGTASSQIKLTAQRSPALVITVADLNAGKLILHIEGFQGS